VCEGLCVWTCVYVLRVGDPPIDMLNHNTICFSMFECILAVNDVHGVWHTAFQILRVEVMCKFR
jgi:hypothetical protein